VSTGRVGVGLTNCLGSLPTVAVFRGRDGARSDCTGRVASCGLILGPTWTALQERELARAMKCLIAYKGSRAGNGS
jgi:hypothetical protein